MLTLVGLGVSSFSELSSHYTESGSGTTFSFGSEETLLLANVAFSTLDAGNFMFPGDMWRNEASPSDRPSVATKTRMVEGSGFLGTAGQHVKILFR